MLYVILPIKLNVARFWYKHTMTKILLFNVIKLFYLNMFDSYYHLFLFFQLFYCLET
ncbi:hypothetical protein EMIT019CA3_20141 [Bacillus pseudomycoides]